MRVFECFADAADEIGLFCETKQGFQIVFVAEIDLSKIEARNIYALFSTVQKFYCKSKLLKN